MEKFGNTISSITNLHAHLHCPMTKQSILNVCKLIELKKLVKLTMIGYSAAIHITCLCLSQYQLYQAVHIISNVKVSI